MNKRQKDFLKIVGITTDGKLVVSGMFEFIDRFGFPTEFFCLECKKRNFLPSWLHFYFAAQKANWPHKRIMTHIEEGAGVWGKDFADVVKRTINLIFKETHK